MTIHDKHSAYKQRPRPCGIGRALPILAASAAAWLAFSPGAKAQSIPAPPAPAETEHTPGVVRDLILKDAELQGALTLIGQVFDLSIASGPLPQATVSLRLRQVSGEEALRALAGAAGLDVERRGRVYHLLPAAPPGPASETTVRQLVPGPVSDAAMHALDGPGLEVTRAGAGVVLVGSEQAVATAAASLESTRSAGRRDDLEQHVFALGMAGDQQTVAAVTALLSTGLETATYDNERHLLVVSALPSTLKRIEAVVAELEREPAQIEIEARMVEVSKTALEQIGADWRIRFGVQGGSVPSSFPHKDLDDSSRFFPSPNDVAELSSLFQVVGQTTEGGELFNPGLAFSRLDASDFRLFFEFLQQAQDFKVIASPKVTTLHNRTALIEIVDTLRIPTFTRNDAFSTQTVTGIETVDVGVTLEVRPRLGRDGKLHLTVSPEVSELEAFQEGLPVISRRRTSTEVVLFGRETLVIGGLVRESERERITKVPVLGDVPGLGYAFRHRATEGNENELLIFITPRLLPPAADRARMTEVDGRWLPKDLARRLASARLRMGIENGTAAKVASLATLEEVDGDLLRYGIEVEPDVLPLGRDPSGTVRAAAAGFLLRRRPQTALHRLQSFAGSRDAACAALEGDLAPHLRAATGELLAKTVGGHDALQARLLDAEERQDARGIAAILDAMALAAPTRAADAALRLAYSPSRAVKVCALGVLARTGQPEHAQQLAAFVATARSPEVTMAADTALWRLAGPKRAQSLLSYLAKRHDEPAFLSRSTALKSLPWPSDTEPALAWLEKPTAPEIVGPDEDVAALRAALDRLQAKTPDYHHLVEHAFERIEVGVERTRLNASRRTLQLRTKDHPAERLSHRLVHLAHCVFETRVLAAPAEGGRAASRGTREEIQALERLSGARCPEGRADEVVDAVLGSLAGRSR